MIILILRNFLRKGREKMAEKYGTVPKKYTKEWWDYFWTYYKWHTISVILLVIVIGTTIYGKITAEKFDLTVTYAGNYALPVEHTEKIEEIFAEYSPDVDGNGEKNVSYIQLQISDMDSGADPQYVMAMNTKLQMSLSEDDTYVFILNKEIADAYSGEEADSCVYAPLEDWLKADIDESLIYKAHGKGYGIDISDMEIFKETGVDFSNHYLFLRYYPRPDQIKKQLAGYEGAIELLNNMLKSK